MRKHRKKHSYIFSFTESGHQGTFSIYKELQCTYKLTHYSPAPTETPQFQSSNDSSKAQEGTGERVEGTYI